MTYQVEKTDFCLQDINSYDANKISNFLLALANNDQWAVIAVDAEKGDRPFDELFSYWNVASTDTKEAIETGLKHALSINPSNIHKTDKNLYINLLEFVSGFSADISKKTKKSIIPLLNNWLSKNELPASRIAAMALGNMNDIRGIRLSPKLLQ